MYCCIYVSMYLYYLCYLSIYLSVYVGKYNGICVRARVYAPQVGRRKLQPGKHDAPNKVLSTMGGVVFFRIQLLFGWLSLLKRIGAA